MARIIEDAVISNFSFSIHDIENSKYSAQYIREDQDCQWAY